MAVFRILLALCRPSRLPTIWSNCLAGWWLGGGGNPRALPLLFGGSACLLFGASFLNDAFDAVYDREQRRSRPLPRGQVTSGALWRWGLAWLAAGILLLIWDGRVAGGIGLVLAFGIILYDATHRLIAFSPVLEGLCRGLLYILGASIADRGITGWSIWCGLALGAYVAGVGFVARWEKRPHEARYWPIALLLVPVFFALVMNVGRYREAALLLSLVLVLWLAFCLRPVFWSPERRLEVALPNLCAGIVVVDWLAVGPVAAAGSWADAAPRGLSLAFIGLLVATLLLQRLAPER